MSQLKARCIDQVLTFENTPVITSGDVNYDSIMFDFCSAWDGFTKTAIFYRSEDEVYYQLLDEANTCTIPNEVLTEKGDIFIGVFGTSGDTTLTSQVLKYKIAKGAITENLKPSDPTPDIYAQIISRYDAIIEELERQFQKLEDLQAEYTGAVGNADTLNGHKDTYFATAEGLANLNGTKALTTSILEKANELPKGVYEFCLGGASYTGTDLPKAVYKYSNATIITMGETANKLVILWGIVSNAVTYKPIINYYNAGSWTGWDTLFTTTGGVIDGNVTLSTDEALTRYLRLKNSKRQITIIVGEDGSFRITDNTNNKQIISSTANGTNTIDGTTNGNLPLNNSTFPTVKNTQDVVTAFESTSGTNNKNSLLRFLRNGVILGCLGFDGENNPVIMATDNSSKYPLLTTNNMGSYVLPLTGGTLTDVLRFAKVSNGNGYLQKNHTADTDNGFYMVDTNKDGKLARLEVSATNQKASFTGDDRIAKELHHDGNSAKVHIGTSAPSDTSALWIDTTA